MKEEDFNYLCKYLFFLNNFSKELNKVMKSYNLVDGSNIVYSPSVQQTYKLCCKVAFLKRDVKDYLNAENPNPKVLLEVYNNTCGVEEYIKHNKQCLPTTIRMKALKELQSVEYKSIREIYFREIDNDD